MRGEGFLKLQQYCRHFSGYTELRVQENRSRQVVMVNGDMMANTSSTRGGVSARVWRKGMWGFASDAGTNSEVIARVIDSATRNARYLATKVTKNLGSFPTTSGHS